MLRAPASMEPRLGSRGKAKTSSRGWKSPCASMEPRLGSRGKRSAIDYARIIDYSFNGAATWKSRKVAVFMSQPATDETLQWSRDLEVAERKYSQSAQYLTQALQWSRDLEVAERRSTCLGSPRRTRFNGAATWKSRKEHASTYSSFQSPSFNGAATWKSRKESQAVG